MPSPAGGRWRVAPDEGADQQYFAAALKGVPLGELAANVVSRLRGFYPQKTARKVTFQRTYVNKSRPSKKCEIF